MFLIVETHGATPAEPGEPGAHTGITAFVAVRLLQLRELWPSRPGKDAFQAQRSCDEILGLAAASFNAGDDLKVAIGPHCQFIAKDPC